MDIRQITPDYFVSPQIDPADLPAIAEAGFTRVICNRPDAENPPSHQAQMGFVVDAPGKVLAYCASGTRCTVIWALGQAGTQSVDDILETARKGGYDLEGLRPTLTAMSQG